MNEENLKAALEYTAGLATDALKPVIHTVEKEHFIVVPEGMELRSLKEFQYAEPPARKAGHVQVQDVASFAEYFLRFRDKDSMVFADPQAFTFTGILDYHEETAEGAARACKHKVGLTLRTTKRWDTWKGANAKPKSQEDFATFIEDNLADIYAPEKSNYPPAAVMLEVSRTLEASSQYTFTQTTNLKNGQRVAQYREQINGVAGPQQEIQIPDEFVVRLPIFLNQPPVEVRCRLRFRINNGKLTMWYDMLRVDEMLAAEFETARAGVAEAAKCLVLLGAA